MKSKLYLGGEEPEKKYFAQGFSVYLNQFFKNFLKIIKAEKKK